MIQRSLGSKIISDPILVALFAIAAGSLSTGLAQRSQAEDPRQAERNAQFEREIRPVLIGQCLKCHGESKQEGGLRLDTQDHLLRGGDSGPAIVAGMPDQSLLFEAIQHRGLEMPPNQKLSDKIILHFERWIAGGAVWPESSKALRENEATITQADREWWAFQPIRKVEAPKDSKDSWSRTEIDRFVWNALASQNMVPAPRADRAHLIRRLYFDLIGLPPSPKEIDDFVDDRSPQAWENVIDRLLADERYGEHWARFWLDLVRYSESDGWNQDAYRPHLWRYRDYVINAFNRDLPYPRFVMDQLAGDEAEEVSGEGLVAAGFLRLGVYEYNQRDARGQWNDIMNEMTDVAGDVFLGMSLACARCHQHKFDPIPQKDYFKFRAFFEPVCWRDDQVAASSEEQQAHQRGMADWEKATQGIRKSISELLEPYEVKKWKSTVDKFPFDIQACFHMPPQDRTSWQEQMAYLVSRQYLEEGGGPYKSMKKEDAARHEELLKELSAFDSRKPPPLPQVMTVSSFPGLISPTVIPEDPRRRPIDPGFLEVLSQCGLESEERLASLQKVGRGRRTELARWIGDAKNPLTMRVIVNRLWQQHFGQGIVSTSSDFGHLGESPTHPELLDWLTATFIEENWSFKRLHKRILLSATWQQSAVHPEADRYQSLDPAERLLWRARVRRLQAEQIRDAMLVVSGELDRSQGGPSISEETPRRSIYVKSFRNQNDTFLHGFDVANGLQSIAIRDSTTTPTQSLLLLNGKYALGRAERFAKRLMSERLESHQAIREAFRWAWGIEPSEQDHERVLRFMNFTSGEDASTIHETKWIDFCHILLNSNPFLYVE